MQIKRYEVNTLREALAAIKEDLGPEAVILSTRDLGGKGKKLLEVVAARDVYSSQLESIPENYRPGQKERPDSEISIREQFERMNLELSVIKDHLGRLREQSKGSEYIPDLCEGMQGIFDSLGLKREGINKGRWSGVYRDLVHSGISKKNAFGIIETCCRIEREGAGQDQTGERELIEKMIREAIAKYTGPSPKKRIQVFIGPTGAGKTTTLAKLAANYALKDKFKVGLITADTYRIAAVEQLRLYAKILDLPVEIATGREDFVSALNRLSDKDVILVDTPGKSRRDEGHITFLNDLIPPIDQVELNLVLSLTSSNEYLLDTAARYDIMSYRNVILTKVDECRVFGFLYDFLHKTRKNVSYITFGQNVPKDIVVSTPSRLTKLIVEAKLH